LSGAQDELEQADDELSASGRPSTVMAGDISDAAHAEAESMTDPFDEGMGDPPTAREPSSRPSSPPPPPPAARASSPPPPMPPVDQVSDDEPEIEIEDSADVDEDIEIEEGEESGAGEDELELEEGEESGEEELDLDEAEVTEELAPVGRESGVPPEPPPRESAPSRPAASPPSNPPKTAAPSIPERKHAWYEEFFSDDYLRTVRPPGPRALAAECNFIVDVLGIEPGTTVLDVGCGLGLHDIELAQRGALVVGLDLSLPMLSRASDEAQERGLQINFLHGDMRDMTFDGAFDAVLCWGTTFGYFDDEANWKVLRRIHEALRPGGKLLLDVVNRDFLIRSQPNSVWFEGDGCVCMEETRVNSISSRLEVRRNVMLDDGRQRDATYSLRVYSLHELGLLVNKAGFRVLSVSGTMATPGVFFGADSPRIIMIAERRVEE
jgi:SAM-dependent methyltransferase